MTSNRGHFDKQQLRRAELLESKLCDDSISTRELLELALLSIEPGHDCFHAAELLEKVLAADPDENTAKLWLAHCWIYEFMDERSLRKAIEISTEIDLDTGTAADVRAAALLLKGAAFYQLSSTDSARAALEASVHLEPQWITNRQLLATIYEKSNDISAARGQLVRAIENTAVPPSDDHLFEWLITGRRAAGIAQRLRDQLEGLQKER